MLLILILLMYVYNRTRIIEITETKNDQQQELKQTGNAIFQIFCSNINTAL